MGTANLDSVIIGKSIELEILRQKTLALTNENMAFKKYTRNLMYSSSYLTYYILLDNNNNYTRFNDLRESTSNGAIFILFFFRNDEFLRSTPVFKRNNSTEIYFDIFEISFFQLYNHLYSINWYVKNKNYANFGGSAISPKIENTVIDGKTIIKELSKNKALPYLSSFIEKCKIIMPPNTTLKIIQNRIYSPYDSTGKDFKTEILIKNEYLVITIQLEYNGIIFSLNFNSINKLGFNKIVKPQSESRAMGFRVFTELKVNENIVFDENSAMQYYWANQLMENIEKTFAPINIISSSLLHD